MFLNLILFFIFNNSNIKCCCFCEKRKNNSNETIDIIQNNEEINKILMKKEDKKDGKNKEKDKKIDDKKDDNLICENEDEFITKFNKRKDELVDKFFINEDLKNKLKSNNLTKGNIGDYFAMYSEMINDVFNYQIAIDLQIYRYILNLEGFTNILDNIIKDERIQYWVIDKYDIKNPSKIFNKIQFEKKIIDENNIDFKLKLIEENSNIEDNIFRSGDCYIDEEKYKYLRCDGCNDKNCLSCKLRDLLTKEGLFKKEDDNKGIFVSLFRSQAQSSHWIFAKKIKNIIFNGLKDELKNTEFYTKYENNELNEDVEVDIRKSFFIEWALTIEFLKRFNKNILKTDKFILYRTLKKCVIKKIDLFESTSLCCPVFYLLIID